MTIDLIYMYVFVNNFIETQQYLALAYRLTLKIEIIKIERINYLFYCCQYNCNMLHAYIHNIRKINTTITGVFYFKHTFCILYGHKDGVLLIN